MQHLRRFRHTLLVALLLGLPDALTAAPETVATSPSPAAVRAQAPVARPLLWAIGSPPTSHLFGTIHIADPRVTTLSDAVATAFDACDEVRTEIPLDPQALAVVAQGLMLPDGQTLSDVLPAELLKRIDTFLQEEGLSLQPFMQMKPWVLASMLSVLEAKEYLLGTPLDQVLYQRAVAEGKAVGGLETVDEQLSILDSLNQQEEIALLEETLEMLQEDTDYIETLILMYVSGDAEALLKLVYEFGDDGDPIVQKYGRRLVEDRNTVMAQRIATLIHAQPERRFFFAVGAGHLGGPQGIVTLLRDAGVVIERIVE